MKKLLSFASLCAVLAIAAMALAQRSVPRQVGVVIVHAQPLLASEERAAKALLQQLQKQRFAPQRQDAATVPTAAPTDTEALIAVEVAPPSGRRSAGVSAVTVLRRGQNEPALRMTRSAPIASWPNAALIASVLRTTEAAR